MYTYGLIVEGVYDKEFLEEFILRCANNEIARSDTPKHGYAGEDRKSSII